MSGLLAEQHLNASHWQQQVFAALCTSHITCTSHTLFKSLLSLHPPHPPSLAAPQRFNSISR